MIPNSEQPEMSERPSHVDLDLLNSVLWDHSEPGKIYLHSVRFGVLNQPFACCQFCMRFKNGPDLDVSIHDLDQIMHAYIKLRRMCHFKRDTTCA